MIDVMMFLLVFFVLISLNVLPALGLKVTPPSAARPDQILERKKVMLTIDHDGNLFVDGTPVAADDLTANLTNLKTNADASGQPLTLVIAGDAEVGLQHLVDVLEAMKHAGIPSSSIVAKAR